MIHRVQSHNNDHCRNCTATQRNQSHSVRIRRTCLLLLLVVLLAAKVVAQGDVVVVRVDGDVVNTDLDKVEGDINVDFEVEGDGEFGDDEEEDMDVNAVNKVDVEVTKVDASVEVDFEEAEDEEDGDMNKMDSDVTKVESDKDKDEGADPDTESDGVSKSDFELDLSQTDKLVEKIRRRRANVTREDGNGGGGRRNGGSGKKMTSFVATTNRGLVPTRPERRVRRKVRSTSAMIRQTDAFGLYFKGGKGLSIDREMRRSKEPDERFRVEVIRGTTDEEEEESPPKSSVLTVQHGLVETVIEAYNNHLNLVLRPDDVWITILTQFAAYVNGEGRAEKLRSTFVSHEGKKQLTVEAPANDNIYTVNVGKIARLMLDEMALNVKDKSLREWFLPGFTTSTFNDEVCASAAAMCTMQEYFEFVFDILCGIPEVTLLGEVADWRLLRRKVDRLLEFQVEGDDSLATWLGLLQRIADNFVESSKNGSKRNMAFWDTVAHRTAGGSSEPFLSGWITAFSYYNADGQVVSPPTGTTTGGQPRWDLLEVTAGFLDDASEKYVSHKDEYSSWPIVSSLDIASNIVSCPVKVMDHGVSFEARLYVGQMAMNYAPTLRQARKRATPIVEAARNKLHVVQGRNDWALVVAKPEK